MKPSGKGLIPNVYGQSAEIQAFPSKTAFGKSWLFLLFRRLSVRPLPT
jgi:hypothetical protein